MKPVPKAAHGRHLARGAWLLGLTALSTFLTSAQTNITGLDIFNLTGQANFRSAYTFEITGWGATGLNGPAYNFNQVISSPELPPGAPGSAVDLGALAQNYASISALTNTIHLTANTVGVACGEKHTLLLKRDGTVQSIGSFQSGQVSIPGNLSNVVAVAAGTDHNLALTGDGRVVAWGWNNAHQLCVPSDLAGVRCVAAGRNYSLALLTNGTVRAWGGADNDADDWLEGGEMEPPSDLREPSTNRVIAIAAGARHALALQANGTVVGWGEGPDRSAWTPPAGYEPFTALSAGSGFSVGLRPDGTVRAWGDNRYHQLDVPPGLNRVVALACGNYHTLALRNDGTVVAWGNNSAGQTDVPAEASHVVAIAAGGFHSEILEQSGPLMSQARMEGGDFHCEMNLTAGQRYRVQASADLREWLTVEVGTALPPSMGWSYRARSTGAAFYRVQRILPDEPDYAPVNLP